MENETEDTHDACMPVSILVLDFVEYVLSDSYCFGFVNFAAITTFISLDHMTYFIGSEYKRYIEKFRKSC